MNELVSKLEQAIAMIKVHYDNLKRAWLNYKEEWELHEDLVGNTPVTPLTDMGIVVVDDEIAQFRALAEEVYCLAVKANLDQYLPQDQGPSQDSKDPIQYETMLNLPCKRNLEDGKYTVKYDARWMERMNTVLRLAKDKQSEQDTQPAKEKKPVKSKASNPVEALLSEDSKEILDIARSNMSTDDRMRAICGLNRQFLSKNSEEWASLLAVSDAAVRKTNFWKVDRHVAIEAWNELTR